MRAGYCMIWCPKKYWPPKETQQPLLKSTKYEFKGDSDCDDN